MGTNIITPKFIERMRSSDYQGTSYAFAEIVDNSFDAEATEIKIISIEKRDARNRRYIDEILFSDNGTGMDNDTLNNCLTFAYGTNDNIDEVVTKKKIGKFGMGLPNASISQCKKIQVFSKTPDSPWRSKRLDIEELKGKDATELDDIEETILPSYYGQVKAIIEKEKGTIVSWKECDRLDRQFAKTLYERAESILGRVFRYHLAKGFKIILEIYEFNETKNTYNATLSPKHIVLNDPLFLTPNSYITRFLWQESRRDESMEEKRDPATYYSKFILGLSQEESLPTNIKHEEHSYIHRFEWESKEYQFKIKTSYADPDIQKPGIREGGKTKVGSIYGEKMKNGNIYFTRHQREISSGHYGFYNLSAENNRWWTIEVDFDADSDELMGVSNTKQGIKFTKTIDDESSINFDKYTASLQQAREKLWFDLSNKIDKAIKATTKLLKKHANEFEDKVASEEDDMQTPVPTGTSKTTQAIKKTDSARKGRFDEEQKQDLIQTLHEKFKELSLEEIAEAADRFDKSLVRGCVIYCPIDNDQLWSYSEIRGFLVIYINTNHEFYSNIIAPFRSLKLESALTAIELFVSSLAWEQNEHFDNDETKKRYLDNFRTLVGMHLNNYLKENNIRVSDEDLKMDFEDAD